jgi:trimeric autotransporter adhesin
MKTKFLSILSLLALAFSVLTPVTSAQARAEEPSAPSDIVSPTELLNPDGTLALDGSFHGSLDLGGYSVSIDPTRGPVFSAEGKDAADPEAVANQWGKLGSSGGVFNDSISDIAVSGTDVYVVGSFLNAGGIPAADRVAKWNGSSWSSLGANAGGDGPVWWSVYTVAVSGSNVYIGGSFSSIDDGATRIETADGIARWDGTHWNALGSNGAGDGALKNGYVYDIAISGSNVYVGGYFTNVNNNGTVLGAADYVAKWNGTNWSALGSNGAGNGSLNASVFTLTTDASGNLYLGGSFTNVESGTILGTLQSADYIAKWNGSNWAAVGTGVAPSYGALNGEVYAIAVTGTTVYAGGSFSSINNKGTAIPEARYIAKFDGSNWSALGGNGAGGGSLSGGYVSDILIDGSNIYVSGGFTDTNNNGTVQANADYIAKWNGTAWSGLGNNGTANGSIGKPQNAYGTVMAMVGSNLLLGGVFMDVNSGGTVQTQADFLAQWNGTGWSALGTATSGSLSGSVEAIAVSGTDVYVGGDFQNAANNGVNIPEADYIAKWDTLTNTWSAVGSNGSGDGSLNDVVYAIVVSGTNIYVGGGFNSVMNSDGSDVIGGDCIVRWDGTQWNGLGNNGTGGGPIWGRVYAIAVSGSNVYAGGQFYNVTNNGVALNNADYVAKFNGTTWSALGQDGSGDGSLKNVVYALAVIGSDVYVGGVFSDVNDNGTVLNTADYLARWNGSNWSSLSHNGANDGVLNSTVEALVASGTNLYVGGNFTDVSNNGVDIPEADYIAKWDTLAGTWSALGSNGAGDGALQDTVYDIAVKGTDVYAGGWMKDTQNNNATIGSADYIAKFNGSNWSALGSNGAGNGALNHIVNAIAVSGLNLYAGGWFTDVNNNGNLMKDADYIAVYDTTPPAAIFSDVPSTYWAWQYIERLYNAGITGGCSVNPLNYCPETPVTRAQMAVFLLVAKHGAGYTPPPATGLFSDVPVVGNGYAAWIEEMANEGITGGCGGGNFCPNAPVTREQMSVFLLVAKHGTGYTPPPAAGLFSDVPANNGFAKWIEQLAAEGITGGCGSGKFCPKTPVTRAQMAVFLVAAFNLP